MHLIYSFNRNEASVRRPTCIDGLRPHLLEVPNNHTRTHSEDSLEEVAKDLENGNTTSGSDEEEKRDKTKDSDDSGNSGDSGDEGLGDITSEASNSPQPPINKNNVNFVKSDDCFVKSEDCFVKSEDCFVKSEDCFVKSEDCDNNPVTQPRRSSEVINNPSSLPTSPCDERVPSRIAFPKTRKSQTHL